MIQFETDLNNLIDEEVKRRLRVEMANMSRNERARIFDDNEFTEADEILEILDRKLGNSLITTTMVVRLFAELIKNKRIYVEDLCRVQSADNLQSSNIDELMSGTWNKWVLGHFILREGELNLSFAPREFKEDTNRTHQLWIRARRVNQ